jgi:hypothetical protein
MKTQLLTEDIKKLKYSCRLGVIISIITFIVGLLFLFFGNKGISYFRESNVFLIIGCYFIFCLIFAYILLRKLLWDILNGEKIIEIKKVKRKEYKIAYEAGSGEIGGKMRPVENYCFIIDNHSYSIDKFLYEKAKDGDEVYLHIAPLSKELLNIELK